jgi:DNA-binding GntR family transcriptional regulator
LPLDAQDEEFLRIGPMQINRLSVADQAATILRQRIIDGEPRPGEHLPEASLASSLGV